MSNAMNRNLSGTRLQGERHGRSRTTVPIKKINEPSKCERAGNPEYPAEVIYAGRRSRKD